MYFVYYNILKIWASKFPSNLENTWNSLEFLEAQFQNVRIRILLERGHLSQLTACILARLWSSNLYSIINQTLCMILKINWKMMMDQKLSCMAWENFKIEVFQQRTKTTLCSSAPALQFGIYTNLLYETTDHNNGE